MIYQEKELPVCLPVAGVDDVITLQRCEFHVSVGTLLNLQPGWGMSSKLVFNHFALVALHLVVICCWHCLGQQELAAQQSFSVQHQRQKVLPPKAWRRSGYHLTALSQDQFPTKGHMPKPRLFSSIPVAADSAESFSRSAGREKVKLCGSYPGSAWTIWESKTPLLWVSWWHWSDVLRAVQAEDGSNALLAPVGWQNVWAMSPWGHTSSRGFWACRVEEGRVCFVFRVLSSHFLVTWNW